MRTALFVLLNHVLNNELKLLFGNDYVIDVISLKYSTNNKSYIIDCKLLTSDLELCNETYPEGLHFAIKESWQFMFMESPIVINTSIDLIPE
jgi:hypothetical protein